MRFITKNNSTGIANDTRYSAYVCRSVVILTSSKDVNLTLTPTAILTFKNLINSSLVHNLPIP